MRQLGKKTKLFLKGESNVEFNIEESIGLGGSCIAYRVSFSEQNGTIHKGILKEYCPRYLEDDTAYARDGTQIIVPLSLKERFARGVEEFVDAYKAINRYLAEHIEAANYHPTQLGLYFGNNTVYSLSSLDYGKSYDKVEDTSLKGILRVVLSVSKAVAQYHEAGYLHLDIKPENILILDGVTELVKLFDYDSLLPIEKLRSREITALPMPGAYYVPELSERNLRAIGVHTDIFEIGALLFTRLFGRVPLPEEMESNTQYPLDSAKLLTGVSPQARYALEQLLRNTLQISRNRRFSSDDELVRQLEIAISLVRDEAPYLLDLPKWQPSAYHLGREDDVRFVRERLLKDGYVFVHGMGGIGKSELAKQYARVYAADYHTVQFCKYNGSLQMLTAALPMHGINDEDYADPQRLAVEKNKVLHSCDAHTLLVIDNFNVTYDAYLRDFLPANAKGFHVIFTTRCLQAAEYYAPMTMELSTLPRAACKTLFARHYDRSVSVEEDTALDSLLARIEYNTLLLTLIAKTMRRADLLPAQMLEKIEAQDMQELQPQVFYEYDYSNAETEAYNRLYSHLNTVYSVSGLQEAEKQTLKLLTLASPDGLSAPTFATSNGDAHAAMAQLHMLEMLGWIELDRQGTIFMHQIVSDLLSANPALPVPESYETLFETLLNGCGLEEDVHISLAMHRLTVAMHLNRRCGDVCPENQIDTKLTLGRLYLNLYRAKEARVLLQEADALSKAQAAFCAPYIHLQQGHVEAEFGLARSAELLYEQTIKEGQADLEQYGSVVLEAMLQVAELNASNNENAAALRAYDRAIEFATQNGMADLMGEALDNCIAIARELDDECAERYYETRKQQMIPDKAQKEDIPNALTALESGAFAQAQRDFAEWMEQCRALYGEESPICQNAEKTQWIFSLLLNDKEQMFRELNSALEVIEKYYGAESGEMAEQLSLMAQLLPEIGEFDYAAESANRAMQILEQIGDTSNYAYTQGKLALASVYLLWGQNQAAREIVDTVDFTEFEGNTYLAAIIRSAGVILCELSCYDIVAELCNSVLKRKTMDSGSLLFAHILLATIDEQQGLLAEAEEHLCQAQKSMAGGAHSTVTRNWLVMCRRCAARIAYRKGDYLGAVQEMNKFLSDAPESNPMAVLRAYAERGLFYSQMGDEERATEDYARAEQILAESGLPHDAGLLLYNNIATHYSNRSQPTQAKNYLQKIQTIRPQVVEPETYFDAVICHNIGWAEAQLGNYESALPLLRRSIRSMESLGLEKGPDYWNAMRHLGLVYIEQGQDNAAIKLYRALIDGFKDCEALQTQLRLKSVSELMLLLYRAGCAEDARALIDKALTWFSDAYGVYGEDTIELMLWLIGTCNEAGDVACSHWLIGQTKKAIEKGCLEKTLLQARLLNYMAVYQSDVEQKHQKALRNLQKSAELFKALSATEHEIYSTVCSNIEYIKNLL